MSHRLALAATLLLVAACGGGDDGGASPGVSFATPCETVDDCIVAIEGTTFATVCTVATCVAGECAYDAGDLDGTECDDGDACTFDDACANRVCLGTLTDCADDDPCTNDSCDPDTGDCEYAIGSFQTCDDGVPCTVADMCDTEGACAGVPSDDCECAEDAECVLVESLDKCLGTYACLADFTCGVDPSTAVVCDPALDTACEVGECQPKTGTCELVARNDGDDCTAEDNPCVDQGVCVNGTCQGEITADCDDGNTCTSDNCVPGQGGCVNTPLEGACDDGDACTVDDVCEETTCTGLPKDCTDANPCTEGLCAEATGDCFQTPADADCDDGDPCTVEDDCDAGACIGAPKDCADDNPCTEDLCEVQQTQAVCKHKPQAGGCDDGEPCTENDLCISGSCIGGTQICKCTVDEQCEPYEDGDPCTGTLVCDTSQEISDCVTDPATVPTCPETGNPCIANLCVPGTGDCAEQLVDNGTECDDGDACTDGGFCNLGACESFPLLCDDSDPCTADLCVDGACTMSPLTTAEIFTSAHFDGGIPGDWEVTSDHPTGTWSVGPEWDADGVGQGAVVTDGGTSYPGPATVVLRSPPFAVYGAETTLRFAAWTELEEPGCGADKLVVAIDAYGATLVQQQICESNGGWTEYELPLDLFQGQVVRLRFELVSNDGANSGFGVALDDVEAIGTFTCDDADPCTVGDSCTGGLCGGLLKSCDDGDLCTADSCEVGVGTCLHEDLDACACETNEDCPGASECLAVACGVDGFCLEVTLPGDCDDGSACTEGDTCDDGVCVGTPIVCEDDEACTEDGCDPVEGCTFTTIETECDDGDPCTVDDACTDGQCFGAPKDCTQPDPCAIGVCAVGECLLEPLHDGQKIHEEKFDGASPGSDWTIEATDSSWTWEATTAAAATPPNSFGVSGPDAPYGPTVVRAISVPVMLPPAGGDLIYKLSMTTPDGSCADSLTVRVGDENVASFCSSTAGFETHAADLGAYGDQLVSVVFEFATEGGEPGDVAVYIDDFKVTARHPCDDGDAATECDVCVLGQCFPGTGCP